MNRLETSGETAALVLGGGPWVPIGCQQALREALEAIERMTSGEVVILSRSARSYIKATRHGDHWSASTRSGSILSIASFTADMTTAYSEEQVRGSRAAGNLVGRIKRWIKLPPPERSLTTAQVQSLFTQYLSNQSFTIPQSGA